MRIVLLLLIGISISLAAALTEPDTDSKPKTAANPTSTKVAASVSETNRKKGKTAADGKATVMSGTRYAKALKPGENRGKRTLYDFGNPGLLYPEVAQRRAEYVSDPRAYYPQSGYFNGQNAIAQIPSYYSPYPHYLEAPEPIIEIIIKDSNETLPEELPQPIVTKKKKEKVHVFYVNYKKDENNKLHLESPIASLNNDDTEEEEEEIVHSPAVVTPQPPLRATTLRTIIHPDSEKYHSNSGIHVTFGSEDKSQIGHILEEHDAESIQRQVVALPAATHGIKTDSLGASTRVDYAGPSVARTANSNQLFGNAYQQHQQSQQQHVNSFYSQQQLPEQQQSSFFRSSQPLGPLPYHQQQSLQQQQQPKPTPQRQTYNPIPQHPDQQTQAAFSKVPTLQQELQQHHHQQPQQSTYFVNHSQQYQQLQQQSYQQQNQYYHALSHKPTQPPKTSTVYFPTSPPKQQELPIRQPAAPYQPVKFRPTPMSKPQSKPLTIPMKLENSKYQQQQQQAQYQQTLQQQQQQYQQKQQQQQQQQQQYHFNRQPQFVQQPTFTVASPAHLQPAASSANNYYKTQQQQQQIQQPQQHQQGQQSHFGLTQKSQQVSKKYHQQSQGQQNGGTLALTSPLTGLSAVHNFFDVAPSKETELLKSIPKFEQHITETVHHQGVGNQQQQHQQQQQQQQQHQYQSEYERLAYQSQNQAIHDIPAPNLGPTAQPHLQQQQQQQLQPQPTYTTGSAALNYVTANAHQQSQQQHSNFVTSSQGLFNSHGFLASTQAPQYGEATDGQKIMIVTPMPPTTYNQYHSSQYNTQNSQQTNQYNHGNSGGPLQAQASTHFAHQPRQSAAIASSLLNANSPFSVSTYHSDVFKELEQRQRQTQKQDSPLPQNQFSAAQEEPRPYIPTPKQVESSPASDEPPAKADERQQPPTQKASQTLLQLPDEVPEDLRQQLFSSGILNNADISILDYDKVGDIALENLPAEHLQHFYGNGGGAQISSSNKVLTVVRPNGDKVSLSEKELERVKQTNTLPKKHGVEVKVVRFDANNEKSVTDKYLKADATMLPPVNLADRQSYNRYLPLKINGAQFPIPDSEELRGKRVVSVVVLAPVEAGQQEASAETRTEREVNTGVDAKEVKFIGGDLIKTLVKKPTRENFKRWFEKEARVDVEQQSVVLLVVKATDEAEQEIFMYDIASGAVNKLNGELSSTFVNVAEENASAEDLEHASTLDPSFLDSMMSKDKVHT